MAQKITSRTKTKLKKGDLVQVIAGRDRGKSGKIIHIDLEKGRVIVEKVNVVKKTKRASAESQKGGIIEIEASMHISNVMLLDTKTNKPTRIGMRFEDGKKTRIAKKSGKAV
ncbi:MAG: 50S ribosomal protein L24 [Spirochaetota bacterium]|jgi:large subunit ribosomal protein L24|nr:50S ribosomal protein L24 [Spirochaetota bacterium]